MNFFKRFFRGKKTLRGILNALNLTTQETNYSVGFFSDEIRAKNTLMRKTRAELMALVLPILNDNLESDYNDIALKNGKITVRKTNFTQMKDEELVIADFIKKPQKFPIQKIIKETNAILFSATTGVGKTVLSQRFISEFKNLKLMVFSTTPEEFGVDEGLLYTEENIELLKNYFKEWLSSPEMQNNDRTLIILDEAFILFSDPSKEIKELAKLINKFLAMNRKKPSRMIFITQTPNREELGDLNISLIATKLINIEDIDSYKVFKRPPEIQAQKLKTGEFYLFHRGETAKILKYTIKKPSAG